MSLTPIYRYVCSEVNVFSFDLFINYFLKIEGSVPRKIGIDLLYFLRHYVNLWEKNVGRSMAYLC